MALVWGCSLRIGRLGDCLREVAERFGYSAVRWLAVEPIGGYEKVQSLDFYPLHRWCGSGGEWTMLPLTLEN